jgi:hypothetical protein
MQCTMAQVRDAGSVYAGNFIGIASLAPVFALQVADLATQG